MADLEIRTSQLSRSLQVGDIVHTDAEEFRDQWWWSWPGVVRESSELEDTCVVEFMGFAQMVTRRRKMEKRHIKLLEYEQARARIDRVLRYVCLPSDKDVTEPILQKKKTKPVCVFCASSVCRSCGGKLEIRNRTPIFVLRACVNCQQRFVHYHDTAGNYKPKTD